MLADINALRGELASLKQERRANNQHGISTIEPEFASVLSSIERSRDVWNNDSFGDGGTSVALDGANAVRTELQSTLQSSVLTPEFDAILTDQSQTNNLR